MSRSSPSFSDFAFRDCPARALEEKGFKKTRESGGLRYGKSAHSVFEVVNTQLIDGKEVDPDTVKAAVDAQPLNMGLKGKLYDSALWFAAEVAGMKPIDAERLTKVEIAGKMWQFKPDAIRLHDDGTILVDEYKTGFVPKREEAKSLVQLQIYALAALRVFKAKAVRTVLWSIKNRVRIPVDWSVVELEQMEPFLGTEAKIILGLYDLIDDPKMTPAKLRAHPDFRPTLNAFCRACPTRWTCPEVRAMLIWGNKPPKEIGGNGSKIETVTWLRKAKNVVVAIADDHDEALRGEIMEAGGEYFDKGWKAWISESKQAVNPQKGGERTVRHLMMQNLATATLRKKTKPGPGRAERAMQSSTKGSSKGGIGKRPAGAASSSAVSAARSRTRSGKKAASGGGKRGGSVSTTTNKSSRTRKRGTK